MKGKILWVLLPSLLEQKRGDAELRVDVGEVELITLVALGEGQTSAAPWSPHLPQGDTDNGRCPTNGLRGEAAPLHHLSRGLRCKARAMGFLHHQASVTQRDMSSKGQAAASQPPAMGGDAGGRRRCWVAPSCPQPSVTEASRRHCLPRPSFQASVTEVTH